MNRIIFFTVITVFFTLFFLLNRYVVSKGMLAIDHPTYKRIFQWAYWSLTLSFLVGQILERGNPHFITEIISGIGSIWLAWLFYILMSLLVIDIFRLIDYFIPFIPQNIIPQISNIKLGFVVVFVLSLLTTIYGYFNARNPIVKPVSVTIDKPLPKDLKIVVVSDLHIGAIVSNAKIERLVSEINNIQPDLVLIAGDLVDHNPRFAIKDEVGKKFLKLHPPMGIYAVTGNHEYIGEAEMSIQYLSQYGIQYLRDTAVMVQNQIIIAGREDKQMQFVTGKKRKPISEILQDSPTGLPVILMDHQPVEYDKAVESGVDLMLSGHTHKGQMWPMNFITKTVFENHYGLYQKGKTWFYTSNGFGTWGPPIRVGNRPEIVLIHLHSNLNP
jgi:predicted MPP superfamily phosphohydrolase